MNLCLIGDRGHIHYVLTGLEQTPHVRVVGLAAGAAADSVAGLQAWCDAHGHAPRVYADYREMLDRLRPDAVSVCGPFELHAQMCMEAFRRGIHVFCEKPVALTLEELEELRALHAATGAAGRPHFAAMMGLRYDPAFYTAWRAVQGGAVGRVRLINAQKSYKLGTRPDYYTRRETYGGTIPWVGSHAIDWIHWFSGESFRSVYASHTAEGNRGYGSLEVSALCQFTLTRDVFASATIDYLRPETAPTHGDDRIRVVGTEGVIEVRDGEVFLLNDATDDVKKLAAACDRQIFRDFLEHIEGRTTALLDAAQTFAVTEACLLARRSADERRIIRWA